MGWLQSASNSVLSGSILGAAYGSDLTAGSKLIVFCEIDVTTVSTVKDGAGNSFSLVAGPVTRNNTRLYVYQLDTPAGDVGTRPTITVTMAESTDGSTMLIQEVSDLATGTTAAAVLDGTPGTLSGSNGSNFSTGTPSYASAASGEYLVSVFGSNAAGSGDIPAAPAGYTADPANLAGRSVPGQAGSIGVAYKSSTGGAEADGWTDTVGGSTDWDLILVAFKLAGGPPPTGSGGLLMATFI